MPLFAGSNSTPGSFTFTPVWTGGAGAAIGNGTLTGQYTRFGSIIIYQIDLVGGSTTNYGNAAWAFTIPAAAKFQNQAGPAYIFNTGVAFDNAGCVLVNSTTLLKITAGVANGNFVNSAWPFTWGNGDELHVTLTYIAA